jgi:hypothetical protein
MYTGTGIDIQLSLHLLLSQLERLLSIKQQAPRGSLQRLRLLNLESDDVVNAGSLAIPGIVSGVCIIFDV